MPQHHGDHQDHGHHHTPTSATPAFAIGVVLNTAFVVIELTCGLLAGSLALIADVGLNLSDVLGLLLAWGAGYLARGRPSGWRTYGLRR